MQKKTTEGVENSLQILKLHTDVQKGQCYKHSLNSDLGKDLWSQNYSYKQKQARNYTFPFPLFTFKLK